jgi:hypothetical protein
VPHVFEGVLPLVLHVQTTAQRLGDATVVRDRELFGVHLHHKKKKHD